MPRLGVPSTTDSAGCFSKRDSRRKHAPWRTGPLAAANRFPPGATIASKQSAAYRLASSIHPGKGTKGRRMATELAVGSRAPGFTLPRDGGGKVALADFRGKKLVIYFYPKADTPGCTPKPLIFLGFAPISRRRAGTFSGSRPIRLRRRT